MPDPLAGVLGQLHLLLLQPPPDAVGNIFGTVSSLRVLPEWQQDEAQIGFAQCPVGAGRVQELSRSTRQNLVVQRPEESSAETFV